MPIFRGTVFLKRAELSVSLFNYGRNYGYLLKKYAELWALLWENAAKITKKSKGLAKLFDDFVAF